MDGMGQRLGVPLNLKFLGDNELEVNLFFEQSFCDVLYCDVRMRNNPHGKVPKISNVRCCGYCCCPCCTRTSDCEEA